LLRLLTAAYGTKRTFRNVRYLVAIGCKADIGQHCRTIAIYEYTP
jgi:hypothetical protein